MTDHFDTPSTTQASATAPEIQDAIAARASRGVFGCADIPSAWYQAYADWWRTRHGFSMETDWLLFAPGAVPVLSSIVRKRTAPAEQVLIQTPVCGTLVQAITDNGRQVLENPLRYTGAGYEIDFDDLEQKLADPLTTLMLLRNPHSPAGTVWSRETLERIGMLAAKHHVTVVADESGCDLTDPGRRYTPFASVSEICRENSITCIGPAKAFNLAGLQTAAVVVPNKILRHKVRRALSTDGIAEPGVFAVEAAIAAYTKSAAWLDERRCAARANKDFAAAYLENEIPSVKAVPSEAAESLWLDCRSLLGNTAEAARFLRDKTGLAIKPGNLYGKGSETFLCLNISCPQEVLQDSLRQLREGLSAYEKFVIDRC